MRTVFALCVCAFLLLITEARAESGDAGSQAAQIAVPNALLTVSGNLSTQSGAARTGQVTLIVSMYANQDDLQPVWTEQHVVVLDQGRYTITVGSTLPDGVPSNLFSSGEARWLGVAVEGESDHQRIMLVSVPYAVRASQADSLSETAAATFVRSEQLSVISENLSNSIKDA